MTLLLQNFLHSMDGSSARNIFSQHGVQIQGIRSQLQKASLPNESDELHHSGCRID